MKLVKLIIFSLVLAIGIGACSFFEPDEVLDPNNPSVASVLNNASKTELRSLIYGMEARHRVPFENATEMFGSFGREVWAFFGSDPRFTEDWLGVSDDTQDGTTYPDFFGSGGTYLSPYQAIKQGNIILQAVENTDVLTVEEANGYTGYAKTIMGFQYLYPLNQQNENGIRFEVNDPLDPGPVLDFQTALDSIRQMLDEGFNELNNAGSSLDFGLTLGYAGFTSPAGLAQINRGIAARAALYDEDFQGALDAVNQSFIDLDTTSIAGMYIGAYHVYGNDPDIPNPFFYPRDAETQTILMVHPSMITDALDGDQRVPFKFFERTESLSNPNSNPQVSALYQDNRYNTNTDPIPFLRNEELILIYAEANAQLGNTGEAVNAINQIRTTWGLPDYSGATTTEALIDEILFQRRYSLWAEGGHRWIDARRYNRIDDIPTELDGGQVFRSVARPNNEIQFDESN